MACALTERIGPHPKLRFSELRFRFRASTLHLVVRTFLTFQLTPSGHYVSEWLTKPYSGELPAFAALSQLANIARFPSHSLMFRPVGLLATPIAPTAVSRYSGFLRSTLRVRWMFHRFRSGPQSDSLSPSQNSGNPPGSRGFYFRAYLSSLPPQAADILTVRFGQLTVEGLSPS